MSVVRALFQCDSAEIPVDLAAQSWDVRKPINMNNSTNASLNLHAQGFAAKVLTAVRNRAADLIRIASYAYAADQEVSRGGETDVYGRKWRRQLVLCAPVAEPDFWTDASVISGLEDVLQFLTGDTWEFHFSRTPRRPVQISYPVDEPELLGRPDAIVLFSGGADSLCLAVDSIGIQGRRPLLISHTPAPHISARQRSLADHLRCRFPEWFFPHVNFSIHRMKSEAADNSQRSRGFLYACLGAVVASELSVSDVFLGDNGVISLNLPINGQFVGALASRATHPKFQYLFNRFVANVFSCPVKVTNPLWVRTRPETLEVLNSTNCGDLLQETTSCSRARGRPQSSPHCGYCSQCVDRRFGSIAAGLAEHDLGERYGVDIFTDPLDQGEQRTIAESYVRFARNVLQTSEDEMFDAYPQLFDALCPGDPSQAETAQQLVSLLKRHSVSVHQTLTGMIRRHSSELAAGTVAETSLLRLAVGSAPRIVSPSDQVGNCIRRAGDTWSATYTGRTIQVKHGKGIAYIAYLLTHPNQSIRSMDLVALVDPPAQSDLSRRMSAEQAKAEDLTTSDMNVQDELFDDQTRRQIRTRLADLEHELVKARSAQDTDRVQRLQNETLDLKQYLRSGTGLGGRPRPFTSPAENARRAVSKAIHRAMETISTYHPQLGRHLVSSLKLGASCTYSPELPTDWNS